MIGQRYLSYPGRLRAECTGLLWLGMGLRLGKRARPSLVIRGARISKATAYLRPSYN